MSRPEESDGTRSSQIVSTRRYHFDAHDRPADHSLFCCRPVSWRRSPSLCAYYCPLSVCEPTIDFKKLSWSIYPRRSTVLPSWPSLGFILGSQTTFQPDQTQSIHDSNMPRAPKAKATATSSAEEDTKPYNRTPSAPPASPGKKGKTWTKADKIKLLLEVIGSQKPDFDMISTKFEGRTRSQVSHSL